MSRFQLDQRQEWQLVFLMVLAPLLSILVSVATLAWPNLPVSVAAFLAYVTLWLLMIRCIFALQRVRRARQVTGGSKA